MKLFRSLFINCILAVFSIAFSIVVFEFLFRMGFVGFVLSNLNSISFNGLDKGLAVKQWGTHDERGNPVKVNLSCLGEGVAGNYSKNDLLKFRTQHRNKKRILVVGDSYTKGHGLRSFNESWPKRLEKELDSDKFHLLTLSHCGFTAWEEWEMFEKKGKYYQPGMVIIGFVLNDIIPKHPLRNDRMSSKEVKERIFEHLYKNNEFFRNVSDLGKKDFPLSFINHSLENYVAEQVNLNFPGYLYFQDKIAWQNLEETYENFAEYSRNHQVDFYIALFPGLQNTADWGSYYQFEILKKVENFLRSTGFKVILLQEAFKNHQPRGLRFVDDAHPNSLAHSLVTRAILKRLEQDERLF